MLNPFVKETRISPTIAIMQVIRIDEVPTSLQWRFVTLYRQAINGELFWEIGFDGKDHMEIWYGYENGIRGNPDRHRIDPKGNRTLLEQALQDISRRYLDKVKEGYQPRGCLTPPETKAMKGYKYGEAGMGVVKRWPVVTQAKLDGMRLLIQNIGAGKLVVKTWMNNTYKHLTYLEQELNDFFLYLPQYATLDGELWSPDFTHNEIIGIAKSMVNIDHRLNQLKFYIFDIICEPNKPYEERYNMLIGAYRNYVKQRDDNCPPSSAFYLLGCNLAHSHEELIQQYDAYLKLGYEGAIIRRLAGVDPSDSDYNVSLYKKGKSKGLLKLKPVYDEEGLIISVKNGEGREKDNAILVVKDPRGNTISMRMAVPFAQAQEWLAHPDQIIGKEVTYQYSCLTEKGVPREPRGKSIRDYEGPDFSR